MSLMKTLAKVAIGVAVAKGASSMMNRGGSGGLMGGLQQAGSGGGLGGMMGSLLGGRGGQGGLGGLLEGMGGAQGRGGLDSVMGGLAGGGLGGLLGGMMGRGAQQQEGSFGEVFASQFDENPEPARQATADQEAAAALMLSAMLQAAKSDGKFDAGEQAKLQDQLQDVGSEERAFVEAELRKPVDVQALARDVPRGMESQVYMMSVLGIDLDNQAEARYLDKLAGEMQLSKDEVNGIHDQLGAPRIYG
ncbi:DUF533 domain-containing protein [Yoonia sp. 2307UL14-13]|uniref:DUF533 domain-containing protein n=1 Tax=Yoonia sp. 2307UL14-13 TaxID=3126506 RepID=UPI0030AA5FD3